MTVSLLEHPVYGDLFSEAEFAGLFSIESDLRAMLQFEGELARVLAECNFIPQESADHIYQACMDFTPDIEALTTGASVDGVVLPELVRQIKEAVGEDFSGCVHKGATSQDVIDTSLIMRLGKVFPKIAVYLSSLDKACDEIEERYGSVQIMAHTRMQQALPIRVSDKVSSWRSLINAVSAELKQVQQDLLQVQFGGPVGTLHSLGEDGHQVKQLLAERLGLKAGDSCWHTNRLPLVKFTDWLAHIAGALGKVGTDIALLSQSEIGSIALSGGGGSSSMPHKNNPVLAEALITSARFVAVQNGAMHQALLHENERSGSAWSLEWMVLPQIVVATGGSLKNANILLRKIGFKEVDAQSKNKNGNREC